MSRNTPVLEKDGFPELSAMFRDVLPNELRNAARAATFAIAGEVKASMEPRIKRSSADGVHAADTILAVRRNSEPDNPISDVRGGRQRPILLMLNYGTSRTKAQPFIEPTVEEMRPQLPEKYREMVGKKLEAAARRKAKKASQ